nr:hypothetical protein [Francisella tularensis]
MCSSTPLKKEISTPVALIMQFGAWTCGCDVTDERLLIIGSNVTGTIVNFVVGIKVAPP